LAASKFDEALSRAMDMIVEAPHRWPRAVTALEDFFFSGFRLQSSIASFRDNPGGGDRARSPQTRYWKQRR